MVRSQERARSEVSELQARFSTDIEDDARLIDQLQQRLREGEARRQELSRDLAQAKEAVKVKVGGTPCRVHCD